jgi:hypothetical protein
MPGVCPRARFRASLRGARTFFRPSPRAAPPAVTEPATAPTEHRLAKLHDLLVELDRDAVELAQALRSEREAIAGDGPLARDLRRAELSFLEDRAPADPDSPDLARRVREARHEGLDAALRDLRATPDASIGALFDLAELRALYRLHGRHADVEAIGELLECRVRAVVIDEALLAEADERYATLASEEESFGLDHKIALLEETGAVLRGLAARVEGGAKRRLDRFASRLRTQASDRVLSRRLERVLTRRGAAILENASLVGLLVVFALLIVDATVTLAPETQVWLLAVDASICLFFITEFAFKLALAPRRGSWFLRNVLIDLIPAIPAAMWFVPAAPSVGAADNAVYLRVLRLLRITAFARYVQALRPLLRLVRLLLFLVKGMDSLVQRFAPLLNRNFVFFERASLEPSVEWLPNGESALRAEFDERSLLFRALHREHVLLAGLPAATARAELLDRAASLTRQFAESPPVAQARTFGGGADPLALAGGRDIPVEDAIRFLDRLRPEEVGLWLAPPDVQALDRIVRVINAPVVRLLPLIGSLAVHPSPKTSEERLVALGRRVAFLLERWRDRMLFFADLHGIVTGPQLLDRVASAIVKFSKRPATRLLLFGGLFTLIRLLLGQIWIAQKLEKFVAGPLLILGAVCLVFLMIGRWLKSIAGEASDVFQMTAEAHFVNLLELTKRRDQDHDLDYLARRVFRDEVVPYQATGQLHAFVRAFRTGQYPHGIDLPTAVHDELQRTALLYMDFLDGAPLHVSDMKTSEQLLANLSLENIRYGHLGMPRKERKRLRRLRLDDGSLLRGPYLWFQCITESIAVETAKRVIDYNRHALTLSQRTAATKEQRLRYARWLRRRRNQDTGRMERLEAPGAGSMLYQTTELHALDFLTKDPERERYLEREFGRHLVRLLHRDRERMVREIFGTQPLHRMPRSKRSINFLTMYRERLSRGRILLLPLFAIAAVGQSLKLLVHRTIETVREILAPEGAAEIRERGRAPFAVAVRKIQRMKAPGLIEAMRLRVRFDPEYSGVPASWSEHTALEETPELERDMEFLHMRTRDREELREIASRVRDDVQGLHQFVRRHLADLSERAGVTEPDLVRRGERAVTIAYITDRDGLRTLARAEAVVEEAIARARSAEDELPPAVTRRCLAIVLRGFRSHRLSRWLRRHGETIGLSRRDLGRAALGRLVRAWHADDHKALRRAIALWETLEPGRRPADEAAEIALRVFRGRRDVSRELAALRAVQTMSVLDVRHYRKQVFDLGNYEAEGESREVATALP